jgi:phosphoglycerol transferase MdoB-like AlkP superfamily enzyme
MNPQQPYQPPPPPRGSEYEFFMNPEKPRRRSLLPGFGSGSSMGMRIGLIAAIAFGVIIILYFILSIFGGSSNKPNLIIVAQDQNELARVATLAATDGVQQSAQSTQNFAQSAELSLKSEQLDLINFMSETGGKPSTKLLAATKDASSDAALNNAIAASSFDTTFVGIMQNQLKSYQSALQTAFNGANNATEKQLLAGDFSAAGLLTKQLNNPTQ